MILSVTIGSSVCKKKCDTKCIHYFFGSGKKTTTESHRVAVSSYVLSTRLMVGFELGARL